MTCVAVTPSSATGVGSPVPARRLRTFSPNWRMTEGLSSPAGMPYISAPSVTDSIVPMTAASSLVSVSSMATRMVLPSTVMSVLSMSGVAAGFQTLEATIRQVSPSSCAAG